MRKYLLKIIKINQNIEDLSEYYDCIQTKKTFLVAEDDHTAFETGQCEKNKYS